MRRAFATAVLAAAILLALAGPAGAHPLGNFTVNRAAALTLTPGTVRIDYTIDMAEIPTVQALPSIDTDGDGTASATELQAWADTQAGGLAPSLALTVDGEAIGLTSEGATAQLTEGQAGLQLLRLDAAFVASIPDGGALAFEDRNDDGRIGWREVTAAGVDGVALQGSDVPAESPSQGLRAYPQDAVESPLDVRSMRVSFAPGISTGAASSAGPSTPDTGAPGGERLAGLVTQGGGLVFLAGLVIALALGAWHALMPGHGKTLMAAAMVGSGAKARQAASAALAVAGMHTASVLVLGTAVLALEASFRPETLYPWLGVLSGLAAAAIGGSLLRRRWGVWRHARSHETHPHDHDHPHTHAALPLREDGRLGLRGIGALALAGGVVPAPSALLALLAAIQLHRTATGVAIVAAFSVGLAAALLGIGLGTLKARDAVSRRVGTPAAIALPVISAAVMVVAGSAIAAGAFARL